MQFDIVLDALLWYNANKGGDTMIPYEVIEAKEILHEGFAELLADVSRIKEQMGLDPQDAVHPVSGFQSELRTALHRILGDRYNTPEDIAELKQEFVRARAYVRELETEDAGKLQRKGA